MKPADVGHQLVRRLLIPLMRGDEVHPILPLGEALAIQVGNTLSEAGVSEEVRQLKLRAARHLHPVDNLGELVFDEWLLLCSLNDLLQLMNPTLAGPFRSERPAARLVELVGRVIERAGAPRSLGEALSRHALFSGIVQLVRCDTSVSWWSGSEHYIGRPPPARLLFWPGLRRVHQLTQTLSLGQMAEESPNLLVLLDGWLSRSPLTAFARLDRIGARFAWSASTLVLIQHPLGRILAQRVLLEADDPGGAIAALARAGSTLEAIDVASSREAAAFVGEAEARLRQLTH